MEQITDGFMREMLGRSKGYVVVLLKATPKRREPGADSIVGEHARRNFALRRDGILSIVCPTTDGSGLSGIGIFNASEVETARIMDADPAVHAGLFTLTRSIPFAASPAIASQSD